MMAIYTVLVNANSWRQHSGDLLEPRPVGDKSQWRKPAVPATNAPANLPFCPPTPQAAPYTPLFASANTANKRTGPAAGTNATSRLPPIVDLTAETPVSSPKGNSQGEAAAAKTVRGLMENLSEVTVKPQWKRKSIGKPKEKKERTIIEMLTAAKLDDDDDHVSEKEDEEDEEEADNKVDGLDVSLLPHQVEGLAWLLARESEKKNRAGILADDVWIPMCTKWNILIVYRWGWEKPYSL